MSGEVKTGAEVIVIFNELKDSCWLVVHAQVLFLPVRSKRRQAIFENLQINL